MIAAATRPWRAVSQLAVLKRAAIPASVMVGILVARAAYGPPHLGYDAWFALAWGRDLRHGVRPDFLAPIAPTPHPLANIVSAIASFAGAGGPTIVATISLLSFTVLGMALYLLGRRLFGAAAGVVAAAIVLTRPSIVGEMLYCSVDVPFLALVAGAGAALVRHRRRPLLALVLLALAGLLRPEAWPLVAIAAFVGYRRGDRPSVAVAVLLVAAAPITWAVFDLCVTGDAFHSLHGTQDLAAELGRPRSASTAITAIPSYLQSVLGAQIAWAGALSALAALWFATDRAALPLTVAGVGLAGFLVLGVASLPLLYRYMLLPGVALAVLIGYGATAWNGTSGRGQPVWLTPALGITVVALIASTASGDLRHLRDQVRNSDTRHDIQQDLALLLRLPAVQRATRACAHAAVPGERPVPELAYRLNLPTRAVTAPTDLEPLHEPAFSPTPGPIARSYTLGSSARETLAATQLHGLRLVEHNNSWAAYIGSDCNDLDRTRR